MMNLKTIICLLASSFTLAIAHAQWSTVGSAGFTSGSAEHTSVALGTNDTPFVAFRDFSNSYKQTVMKYNGSSWSIVGSAGISAGNSANGNLIFNSSGVPYLAFQDGANAGVTVMKYTSSWSTVGSAGFSSFSTPDLDIALDSNDTPYVVFDYNGANHAGVMKYNGSSWTSVGSAFTTSAATWSDIVFDSNNTPYVAFKDGGNSDKASVKKYNGSSWVNVGSAGFSAGAVSDMALAISDNDTLYVSFQDGANSNKLTVMKYNGSSWVNVGSAGFTTSDVYLTSIQIVNEKPYVAYSDGANSYKLSVSTYNGSSWSYLGSGGLSAGIAWYLSMAKASNNDLYVSYEDYGNSNKATVMKYHFPSTTWNGSTWSSGSPSSTVDAVIASSTTPGSFTCKNLTINSSYSLTLGSSATATIYGDLTNSGNGISGTGNLTFAKSGTASLSGTAFSVKGTVTVNSGCTLSTGSLLTLAADGSNTGSLVGPSSGSYISGNVTVQAYLTGVRAFRFFGHPFSSSQALTTLTDDIDITGSGGSANGFTTTNTNNPSAFWFDVTAADNSTTGNNPGWTAFTNTNGTSSNSWDQYELIRVLGRGAKGEGLTGGSYTPSAVTVDMTGTVNQGDKTITLTKGSGSNFVGCGNPFPSGVQMQSVSKGSNVGSNYYAWDATSGAAGAYVTNAFSLSYVLPSFGAFFTTVSANSNNTITIQEADKDNAGVGLFKTTAPANWVELLISDSSTKWDRLLVHLDSSAMDVQDHEDAIKLYNPGLDFFTVSKDNERLAIDVRPYTDGSSIPLGLTAYNRYNKYVIKTGMFDIPKGTKLYLHDKYLKKTEELKTGFEYWFDVTSDTNSQGRNRFEINMVGKPTTGIFEVNDHVARIQLVPNPAQSAVKVSFDKLEGQGLIRLMSVTGRVLYSRTTELSGGSITIPLYEVPAGIYIVELQGDNARFTEKLIKE